MSERRKGILVLGFIAVLLASYCFKIIQNSKLYVSLEEIAEKNNLISEEEIYLADLRAKKQSLIDQIDRLYLERDEGNRDIQTLRKEIDEYKMYSQFSDVYGEGITIIVDDGERDDPADPINPQNLIVHDLDVRRLVMELQNAGAEAISVNENRIVIGLSEVVCNGPTIRINGIQQSRPYVIKAIGDRYELARKLSSPDSYGHILLQYGVNYEVYTNFRLKISGYTGFRHYDYVNVLED